MQAEGAKYLQAADYERAEVQRGQANGYKTKTVKTHVSAITIAVLQFRESGFFSLHE